MIITHPMVILAIGVTALMFFIASYRPSSASDSKHHSNYQPRKNGKFVKEISYPEVKELRQVSARQWRRDG